MAQSESNNNDSDERRLVELGIGVTGHRLAPKLPPETKDTVHRSVSRLLNGLQNAAGGPLVIVSALAEGADQIVAEEGLRLGAELDVILPFAPEEYLKDFQHPETVARFDRLCRQSRHVLSLDHTRAQETVAYEAAGLEVLSRSDVLIAIWDGKPADGRGGTGQIVEQALSQGMNVVQIKPAAPNRLVLLTETRNGHLSDLTKTIAALCDH